MTQSLYDAVQSLSAVGSSLVRPSRRPHDVRVIDRDKFGFGRRPSVTDKPGILLAVILAIMRGWTSIGVAIGAALLLGVTALNTVHGLPLGATAAAANSEVWNPRNQYSAADLKP